MLKELDLTYVIRNQVLMITTPEEAESRLASRCTRSPIWRSMTASAGGGQSAEPV